MGRPRRSSRLGLIAALVVLSVASGQEKGPAPKQPKIDRVATPSEVVGWVLADLAQVPESSRPFVRYVWVPPWGTGEWHGAISFAVNTAANRGSVIRRPVVLANGYLLRWDLRGFASDAESLREIAAVWDGLAVDEPYFHVPKVNKTERVVTKTRIVEDNRGRQFEEEYEETVVDETRVAVLAPHIDPDHASALAELNVSPAICYRADWLVARILSATDGGVYYEMRGISRSPNEKQTDQQHFLGQFGANEALSAKLNGDQRVAMFRSHVTGKPRRIDGFRGVAGRFSTGQVWVTHDIRDGDVKIDQHPIYNLLDFRDAAREIIVEGNNGLHVFGLFDGQGALVREVPPDIAKDHRVPAPNTARLQPAISCISCHGPDDGLRDCPNDVRTLLGGRLDAFDDLSNLKRDRFANVDRLAGLYAGRFERRIRLGRDDYDAAVRRATGGMGAKDASELVWSIYSSHQFEVVSPARAALELGFRVDDGLAAQFLQQAVVDYGVEESGISFEDVAVAALRQGLSINRRDFDRIYGDMAVRISKWINSNKAKGAVK